MKTDSEVPLIYNLFPRFFRTIDEWSDAVSGIKEMKFNSVFVNPFHMTGFSGSLYAVKDYYKLNPLFLKEGQDPSDFSPLNRFVDNCRGAGLELIMDLVINHTAFDADLTQTNPQWYKREKDGNLSSPYAVDPADPSNVTVWGDLAIIDNKFSTDRENLWKYWDELVSFYQNMGILGFRCDAAYQVPSELWEYLISRAKGRHPQTRFYAETLGCQLSEIEALGNAGFDYLFNSSKWWEFDKPWALEQHELNKKIAPSISFPESHDTERLASVPPGTPEAQKCRYAFAALFSKGLMMPQGYEHGATTRMDVVKGTPEDADIPKWDLGSWISGINELKSSVPVLGEEGSWRTLCDYRHPFLFLEKRSDFSNPSVFVCLNKNMTGESRVEGWMVPEEIQNCSKAVQLISDELDEDAVPEAFMLEPADVVLFLE